MTPFHQLLHHIFYEGPTRSSTEFVLLHAYRSIDEIPPTTVMQNFSKWSKENPGSLIVSTFVEDGQSSQLGSFNPGRVTEAEIRKALESNGPGKTLVLLCGPDP